MAIKQEILDKLINRKHIEAGELASMFMDVANGAGSQSSEFAEVVTSEHRYLQSQAFSHFLFCIEAWAKAGKAGQYDDRNKAACELSVIMIDALKAAGRW